MDDIKRKFVIKKIDRSEEKNRIKRFGLIAIDQLYSHSKFKLKTKKQKKNANVYRRP